MEEINRLSAIALFSILSIGAMARAGTVASDSGNNALVVEAESGTLGADFSIVTLTGEEAITIGTDFINTLNPGSADRIATYEVTFPEAGPYDLFARIYVGPGGYNDDSYFIPGGFGFRDPAVDSAWFRVNGLAAGGYTEGGSFVEDGGTGGIGVWKWVNLNLLAEGAEGKSYVVPEDSLTRVFQTGAREDGLYIDKLAFGKTGLLYTVEALMTGGPGLTEYPRSGTPLAEGQEKFLGSAWDLIQEPEFEAYWNQLTPGNAGKWESVEWTRDQMNWAELDAAFTLAKRYGMVFKEHTLFWGAQQPQWMNDLDSAQQRQEIEEWLGALAERYGSFDLIDVVNEPIHNAPNGMLSWGATEPNIDYAGALGGAGETGWDWILEAFRLARRYFPDSKLILNEYSVINSTPTTQKMIEIVNLLQAENLIDGIGEQAHAFTTHGVSAATLKANLDALAATGIPLYITEFDIDGPTDLAQLWEIQRVFPLFWEHPAVAGVTLWGHRYGVWRNDQGAYLINEDGTERLAMKWLKAYVNDTLHMVDSIHIESVSGDTMLNEAGETLSLKADIYPWNATIPDFLWSVSPASVAVIDQDGILTAVSDGTATVKATAQDGSWITGSMEIQVMIADTVPGDTIPSDTLSVPDAAFDPINVYPNPSPSGRFYITGLDRVNELLVLDLTGKRVATFDCKGRSEMEITLPPDLGLYLFEFRKDRERSIRKVIMNDNAYY